MRTRRAVVLLVVAVVTSGISVLAQKGGKLTSDDLVEIQQLYAKYNWTLDGGDAEGYASTFTPDGVFNNNVGHDAIVKFANTFHAGLGAHVHHWNTNLMILPTATGASGQVYLVLVDFANKPATFVIAKVEALLQQLCHVACRHRKINFLHRHQRRTQDNLHRLAQPFPQHRCTQNVMPVYNRLQRR